MNETLQNDTTNKDYLVNLDVFEGPLDLLLYLIKKNDLEITEIPIALITEEYLKYLDAMQELNVNIAGEYLYTAAELMLIKSKMLLPVEETEEVVEEESPLADLQRRLLEYQRYKDAASDITDRVQLHRDDYKQLAPEKLPSRREVLREENVFKLLEAFHVLLSKLDVEQVREITIDRVSVNECIFKLMDVLKIDETVSIEKIVPENYDKYDLVVTFLALLEMSKLTMIKIIQAGKFQTLYITRVMQEVTEKDATEIIESTSF